MDNTPPISRIFDTRPTPSNSQLEANPNPQSQPMLHPPPQVHQQQPSQRKRPRPPELHQQEPAQQRPRIPRPIAPPDHRIFNVIPRDFKTLVQRITSQSSNSSSISQTYDPSDATNRQHQPQRQTPAMVLAASEPHQVSTNQGSENQQYYGRGRGRNNNRNRGRGRNNQYTSFQNYSTSPFPNWNPPFWPPLYPMWNLLWPYNQQQTNQYQGVFGSRPQYNNPQQAGNINNPPPYPMWNQQWPYNHTNQQQTNQYQGVLGSQAFNTARLPDPTDTQWYMDSGATSHLTSGTGVLGSRPQYNLHNPQQAGNTNNPPPYPMWNQQWPYNHTSQQQTNEYQRVLGSRPQYNLNNPQQTGNTNRFEPTTAMPQAFNTATLPDPTDTQWYTDSGATSYLTSGTGFRYQGDNTPQ